MNIISKLIPPMVAVCLCVGSPLWAQEDPSFEIGELSLSDLLNIKLTTGSFLELDMSKSPLSMTLISKNKIRLSGARHISELLEIYVPGFQYAYNKWNGLVWGMRGVMNDRNTKFIVLVNGHKMNTEARDGFIQETVLPGLDEIERIEALRGPAGLVYGSGAIAGIINIVTRKGEAPSSDMSVTLGTWGSLGNTSKVVQGVVQESPWDDFSFTLYGAYGQSDGQGEKKTLIYGADSWPYPTWETHNSEKGVLSNGSAFENPGSWKLGGTFEGKKLSGQARLTRQVQNVGGLMIADMWPHTFGVDSSLSGVPRTLGWVHGLPIDPNDNPYTVNDMRARQTKGREYVSDNIMADLVWTEPLGEDELKIKLAFDGNTNRMQYMGVPGAEAAGQAGLQEGYIMETSGERRYTAGATWLMKRITDLQLAAGFEFRLDDIGKDLSGQNYMSLWGNETQSHIAITPVQYLNRAVFVESMYDLSSHFSLALGGRWDGHTRTIDDGGTLNGKAAVIFLPTQGHSVKLITQTSTNNATADNYEYNRQFYDDFGNVITKPMFEDSPTQHPNSWTAVFASPTKEQLHAIEPERTVSFELVSTHEMSLPKEVSLFASPGVSYNQVSNLLAWDNNINRVDNTGDYEFINAEIELDLKSKHIDIGVNHTYQVPVNLDLSKTGDTLTRMVSDGSSGLYYDSTLVHGIWQYYPKNPVEQSYYYNSVEQTVSADEDHFLNLATHLTKMYVDVRLTEWLALHSDARVFWGYEGRSTSIKDIDENSAGYGSESNFSWLGFDDTPIVKWNAGAQLSLGDSWTVQMHVYDLLAGKTEDDGLRHSLRPQVKIDNNTNGLYAIDNRAYALKIEKKF